MPLSARSRTSPCPLGRVRRALSTRRGAIGLSEPDPDRSPAASPRRPSAQPASPVGHLGTSWLIAPSSQPGVQGNRGPGERVSRSWALQRMGSGLLPGRRLPGWRLSTVHMSSRRGVLSTDHAQKRLTSESGEKELQGPRKGCLCYHFERSATSKKIWQRSGARVSADARICSTATGATTPADSSSAIRASN